MDSASAFDPLLSTFVASLILLLGVVAVHLVISFRTAHEDEAQVRETRVAPSSNWKG